MTLPIDESFEHFYTQFFTIMGHKFEEIPDLVSEVWLIQLRETFKFSIPLLSKETQQFCMEKLKSGTLPEELLDRVIDDIGETKLMALASQVGTQIIDTYMKAIEGKITEDQYTQLQALTQKA